MTEKSILNIQKTTEIKTIKVFVGTFNVSGQSATESLAPWLVCEYDIDVYAIGFQELDLSPEAYILSDSTREEDWCRAVTQGLGDKAEDYWKITSKQLVGILLVVMAKKKYIPYIKEIRTDCAGVGLMGMMGNKGGVAIRFKFYDSYLCFVNCHLAADPNGLERRSQDYMEICRRTTFPINANEGYSSLYGWVGDYIPPSAKYAVSAVAGGMSGMVGISITNNNNNNNNSNHNNNGVNRNGIGNGQNLPIFDNDHLIWMGDLNYRIAKLPEYEVKNCLENDEIDLLLNFDQLTTQRRNKSAFHEFEEGEITFLPTYKYDFGTNDWDTSEKKRSPAWTDRILWRSKEQSHCKQLTYRSHMEITLSDHKPVSSIFELKLHVNIIEEEEGFNDRDDGHNVIIEKESYQIEDNDECDTL